MLCSSLDIHRLPVKYLNYLRVREIGRGSVLILHSFNSSFSGPPPVLLKSLSRDSKLHACIHVQINHSLTNPNSALEPLQIARVSAWLWTGFLLHKSLMSTVILSVRKTLCPGWASLGILTQGSAVLSVYLYAQQAVLGPSPFRG